jgi:hypothetical protein
MLTFAPLIFNFSIITLVFMSVSKRSQVWVFSPVSMMCIGLMVMYVFRPIYLLQNGEWGVEFNYKSQLSYFYNVFQYTLWLSSLFIFILLFPFILEIKKKVVNNAMAFPLPVYSSLINKSSYISAFFLLFIFIYLIQSSVGIIEYFARIGARQVLLKEVFGQYAFYITGLTFFIHSMTLIRVANDMTTYKKIHDKTWLLLLLVVLLFIFLGGRSHILFFMVNVLFLYLIFHGGITPASKLKVTMILFMAFILFGVVYRVFFRDVYFEANVGVSISELIYENITGLFGFVVGGGDFAQFDALMTIVDAPPENLLWGASIFACIVSFIPRALWAEKPVGGMAEFTGQYFPWHYEKTGGGEFIVSWFGELILNFGISGAVVGVMLTSVLFYRVELIVRNPSFRTVIPIVIMSLISVRFFNIIKADLMNNFMAFLQLVFIPFLLLLASFLKHKKYH